MYIADLHIHSRYSRATSRDCTPEHLDLWARRKGIHILGTGDFTHRAWREELQEKLEPAEEGLYRLKREYRIEDPGAKTSWDPRFVVTGEISSIYKKYDKTRKVHSLILLPGLADAAAIAAKLETIGNIHSDGRPILGLDCHDLLELVLELCPRAIYVPAHIWTPHFSIFGAFSGFDRVEECFGDLSPYIHAMETGLSSDPPMIWQVSALDRFQLISNSDAHSPAKLGREANLLDISLSYEGLYQAIQAGEGLLGTIEFFPEEGKYHFDGHRKCGVCLSPLEAERHKGSCPVCGRRMTMGVSHRIAQLSDRPEGFVPGKAKAYESLVPLPEVIGASMGRSAASVRVIREYETMLEKLGSEFEILRTIPVEEIRGVSGTLIAEGIRRLREGRVNRTPGFDGEYGKISLFRPEELESPDGQLSFLGSLGFSEEKSVGKSRDGEQTETGSSTAEKNTACGTSDARQWENAHQQENARQQEAIRALDGAVAVTAGPGTGKTFTLISHILYLTEVCKVKPKEIMAVTFTNRAAAQLLERLGKQCGKRRSFKKLRAGTFHALCLSYLQEKGETKILADEMETLELIRVAAKEAGLKKKPENLQKQFSLYKTAREGEGPDFSQKERCALDAYNCSLKENGLWDYDDLLLEALDYLQREEEPEYGKYLLVDEFQDINPIQYELLKCWNRKGRQLFVIGDPDQSIYGFRGSTPRCFEELRQDFPQIREISLLDNYRSTPEILEAALSVISRNPGGKRILQPHCPAGPQVRFVAAKSSFEEGAFLAREIARQVGGVDMIQAHEGAGEERKQNRSFGDFAVLYRTHRQAELLERCLRQEGIPCIIGGRDGFLSQPSVRGALSFFRFLLQPEDERRKRICREFFRSLGENERKEPGRNRDEGREASGWSGERKGKNWAEYQEERLARMTEKYGPLVKRGKPAKILEQWAADMGLTQDSSIRKLLDMACLSGSMEEFLNHVLLGVESDLCRCPGRRYTTDAVHLMTLHGAKGLEFPVVFLCGVEKDKLPLKTGAGTADLLEERRLFYVGMTRAREELVLLAAGKPSEFLEEIPKTSMCREIAGPKKQEESVTQLSLFDLLK